MTNIVAHCPRTHAKAFSRKDDYREILQCDFPGFWVTWFVTFFHSGHLIGPACGPIPLQIEAVVKKTQAVCAGPSGDSGGGCFSVWRCKVTCVMEWSRFTAMYYLLRPAYHLWLEAAGSTLNLTA